MADDNKGEDPNSSSGELIPKGAPLPLGPARTAKGRTIDRLLSKLSIWPFRNRAFVKSLETAQEVIEKQTKLEDAIIGHGRTRGRLNDLEITLAQDRLQRRREFIEERGRLSAALNESMLEGKMMDPKNKLRMEEIKRQQREQRIQRMEQEKRELLLAKELEELTKPPPPASEPPKQTTTRTRSPKQKRREDAHKRYEKEIERIEARKMTAKTKAELTKAAQNELEEELETIEKMP